VSKESWTGSGNAIERTDGDGRNIDDSYVSSVSVAHVDATSSKDGGGGEGADNDGMGTERGTDGAKVTGDDGGERGMRA
jgi:hypothetical protein